VHMTTAGTVGPFALKVGLSTHTGSRDGSIVRSALLADNHNSV